VKYVHFATKFAHIEKLNISGPVFEQIFELLFGCAVSPDPLLPVLASSFQLADTNCYYYSQAH
jgi:hypothetical protein